MPEFYLKAKAGEEAQGPFGVETLRALAREGKITPESLHFYDDLTGWQPIAANPMLMGELFNPEGKPKLSLKKSTPHSAPEVKAKEPGLTVEKMLESAQGHTQATASQTQEKQWADRVAALSLPVLTLLNLAMGALLILANWDPLQEVIAKNNYMGLLLIPGVILGGLAFLWGALMLLGLVSVYPAVRYTGLALLAYLGVHAWGHLYLGQWQGWLLLGAGLGFGIGTYIITLTLRFWVFALALLVALGGVGAYAYFLFLGA